MASPHRSESFFHDGPTLPSILLVPIGDGDSFDVVLGPVLTLVRSEEASLEQLLDSPEAEVPTSESLAEAHVSWYLLFPLLFACSLLFHVLMPLFYFVAGPSAPASPPEATDVPIPDPVPPVSGDEAIGRIFSSFIFL
jgi:hypothetical protein